jgi:hypothetical protein
MSGRVRAGLVAAIAGLLLSSAALAAPETRTFVIGNVKDGYGINTCLASGAPCGQAAAAAFCRTRAFPTVASFARVERLEVTGSVTALDGSSCGRAGCEDFIAIVCAR